MLKEKEQCQGQKSHKQQERICYEVPRRRGNVLGKHLDTDLFYRERESSLSNYYHVIIQFSNHMS